MAVLKRVVKLTLTSEGTDISLEDLRVDFTVHTELGYNLDKAMIDVYNLNYATIKALSSSKEIKVRLEIGNKGQKSLDTLFEGVLMNIQPVKMYQDHVTTLFCWSKNVINMGKPWNESRKGSSLKDLIDSIADQGGYKRANYQAFTEGEVKSIQVNKIAQTGTLLEVLTYLALTYGFKFCSNRGVLYIAKQQVTDKTLNEDISKMKDIVKYKVYENLIRKPASFSLSEVKLSYRLSPKIIPSNLIEIPDRNDSTIQRILEGTGDLIYFQQGLAKLAIYNLYQVMSVKHAGSNYTDKWDSEIYGLVYSNNKTMGGGK